MMSITPCCAAFHYSHSDIKTKNCYLHRIELTTRFEEHQNRQRKIYTKNKWVIEEALAPAAVVLASRSTATVHNAKLIESDDGCAALLFIITRVLVQFAHLFNGFRCARSRVCIWPGPCLPKYLSQHTDER